MSYNVELAKELARAIKQSNNSDNMVDRLVGIVEDQQSIINALMNIESRSDGDVEELKEDGEFHHLLDAYPRVH